MAPAEEQNHAEAHLWRTAYELFEQALDLPGPGRETYVRQKTSTEPALQRVALELLKSASEENLDEASLREPERIGTRIGRYQITRKLGSGGMSLVYAGYDTELGRTAALKFLTPAFLPRQGQPDRLIREAKAASALNHPHIVTIFDIIHQGDEIALAMELVEGRPLREFCGAAQPVSRVIWWARQIAQALAATHAKGIIHRDLKPDNVMARPDGHIKVLDFGLARYMLPGAGSQSSLFGLLGGTLNYMSPEQTRGEEPTTATDIFSLGTVLYELICGRHPYQSASPIDTAWAIAHVEPKPPETVNPDISPALSALIMTMLAKDAAKRPTAAAVEESLNSMEANPVSHAPRKRPRWNLWLAAAGAAAALTVVAWMHPWRQPPSLQGVRPLIVNGGRPAHPSISPAGDMIAFDWSGPDDPDTAIYIQRMEDTSPVRLTPGIHADFWPVWSPDGKQIAFLRETAPYQAEAIVIPVVGIGERALFEIVKASGERPRLDWSADGRLFATAERKRTGSLKPDFASSILLFSAATGERRTLTHPPEDWHGDSEPIFSPDSKVVAFRRTRPASGDEDIFEVPVAGGDPRGVTADRAGVAALVYTPDHGLLFSSRRGGGLRNLWWMPPGDRTPRLISDPAFDLGSPAVSRDGRHLAYVKVLHDTNIWRLQPEDGHTETVSASEFIETGPAFSPDGQKILFVSSRTGTLELWTASASGANAVRLTASGGPGVTGPQWSPDGRQIAFEWRPKGREGIYLIPASGGTPRPLVTGSALEVAPRWSRDGRFVYFNSNRGGRQQIWRIPAAGGEPVRITKEGGSAAAESADGSALYYAKPEAKGIWTVRLKNGLPDGAESQVIAGLESTDWANWALVETGIYFIQRNSENRNRGTICFFDSVTRQTTAIYPMKAPPLFNGGGLVVSPDGRTILFAQVDRDGTTIYGR